MFAKLFGSPMTRHLHLQQQPLGIQPTKGGQGRWLWGLVGGMEVTLNRRIFLYFCGGGLEKWSVDLFSLFFKEEDGNPKVGHLSV